MIVEPVCTISDELYQALERLMPQLSPLPLPAREELAEIIAAPGCTLLAARLTEDGPVIGMLSLVVFRVPTGVRAWIEDVVVDESARGQGAGAALTRAALNQARALGAKCVELTSRPAREAANRLYQQMGFTQPETNFYRYTFER